MSWDALSEMTEIMALDILCRVANLCAMFCLGWPKKALDVLSWESGDKASHTFLTNFGDFTRSA